MASMALEYSQVRAKDMEMMSVLQRANEGPNGMLLMYAKAWLKSHKNTIGFLTLLLMVIINLTSQLFRLRFFRIFKGGSAWETST
jgi:hypothetical protein